MPPFYTGPVFGLPACNSLFITFFCQSFRPLTRPIEPSENLPDMAWMIFDAGLPFYQISDSFERPKLCLITVCCRTLKQGLDKIIAL